MATEEKKRDEKSHATGFYVGEAGVADSEGEVQ